MIRYKVRQTLQSTPPFFLAALGLEPIVAAHKAAGDDYSYIMAEALADRLAEALAERLHQLVRSEVWGYSQEEDLDVDDLLKVKYQVRGGPRAPGVRRLGLSGWVGGRQAPGALQNSGAPLAQILLGRPLAQALPGRWALLHLCPGLRLGSAATGQFGRLLGVPASGRWICWACRLAGWWICWAPLPLQQPTCAAPVPRRASGRRRATPRSPTTPRRGRCGT